MRRGILPVSRCRNNAGEPIGFVTVPSAGAAAGWRSLRR